MFFLITNIVIGKYYPNLFTQFVVGFVCYLFAFFILKDFISPDTYQMYKYYILFLIGIDAIFLVYRAKSQNIPTEKIEMDETVESTPNSEDTVTEGKSLSPSSLSFSDEINDLKIIHDISTSSDNYSLFSSDVEKTDDKENQNTTS